ncbi:MAG: glycosyltransferase, partial [Erysipelotrichaceae bacterium]
MKRVLYIHGGLLQRGGTEAYMMNYYRHLDHSQVQIDFAVHGEGVGVYDEEIKALGGTIVSLPLKLKHPIRYRKALKELLSAQRYDIVHSH